MCTSWSSVNKCIRRRNAPLLESGIFAKYGDCRKWDEYISPKIPRSFPVTCTQIVECILLLNLKFFYGVGFDVIHKGCRLGEFVLMLSYFGCWIQCVWSVDIDISYWSWTNFIVDLNNKCWCWQQFDLLYFAPLWLPYHITFSWTWPLFFFHRIQQVLHIHSMFWKVTTSPLCGSTTLMERSRMLF